MLEKLLSAKELAKFSIKAGLVVYGAYLGIRNYDVFEFFKHKIEERYIQYREFKDSNQHYPKGVFVLEELIKIKEIEEKYIQKNNSKLLEEQK